MQKKPRTASLAPLMLKQVLNDEEREEDAKEPEHPSALVLDKEPRGVSVRCFSAVSGLHFSLDGEPSSIKVAIRASVTTGWML